MEICKNGNLENGIWKKGNLEKMEIWKNGNLDKQKFGKTEI